MMKRKKLKLKREKLKPKGADRWLAMSDYIGFKSAAETRHWRYCDACGKRFSEQNIVWVDGLPFCGKCLKKKS